MTADQLAIGIFLFSAGLVIALSAFALGITLFKDDDAYRNTIQSRRQLFWLEKLVRIQKPEYQLFSWLLHGLAALLMLGGSAWMLYFKF